MKSSHTRWLMQTFEVWKRSKMLLFCPIPDVVSCDETDAEVVSDIESEDETIASVITRVRAEKQMFSFILCWF